MRVILRKYNTQKKYEQKIINEFLEDKETKKQRKKKKSQQQLIIPRKTITIHVSKFLVCLFFKEFHEIINVSLSFQKIPCSMFHFLFVKCSTLCVYKKQKKQLNMFKDFWM